MSGKRGKDDGMGRADRNANEAWKQAADEAVLKTAREKPVFTTDDVLQRIPENVLTHEMRALGPVMLRAAKNGWIEKSLSPNRSSRRPTNHLRPLQVWDSLIHKRQPEDQ
jgi:hypothetical protein